MFSNLKDEVKRIFKTGIERSSAWMHLVAAFTVFASDVVEPLVQQCTGWLLVAALGCGGGSWFLGRFRVLKHEIAAAFIVFFAVTAGLSGVVYAAQKESPHPEKGVAAQLFPAIQQLQVSLNIIDRRTQRIETKQDQILGLLHERERPHPSIISQHIAGLWGEGDCSVVSYRFAKEESALVVEGVNRPKGAKPYKFVGTIIGDKDTSMEVRGEAPEAAKGLSATFRYEGNGVTERLHWQDHVSGGTDVELNRCAGEKSL